jgi:hypothetical protein
MSRRFTTLNINDMSYKFMVRTSKVIPQPVRCETPTERECKELLILLERIKTLLYKRNKIHITP